MSTGESDRRVVTVPNALGVLRLLASPWLVVLGGEGRRIAFLLLFLGITFTDWLDGKLAVWLDQRSPFGARLDTVADVVMYATLVVGLGWLEGPVLVSEWPWMAAAVASYLVSCGVAVAKFGRFPSYHTRSAKTSWLLVLLAVVALVAGRWVWPLRIAALAVTSANAEAVLLTRTLEAPREDVPSLFDVLRERRGRTEEG